MTALAADRNTPYRESEMFALGVAPNIKIYGGAIVMLNASGYATKGAAATGQVCAGRAEDMVDNTGGADAAKTVNVRSGTFKFANSASGDLITIAEIGDNCSIAAPPPDLLAALHDPALPAIMFAGLLVNKASLNALFTGLKTIFHNTLKATPGNWQATAMEVASTSAREDYAWLSRFPKFRKWVGEKFIKNLEAGKYYKANQDWETTIAVKRNDIEDDRLGLYNNQATGAGEAAGRPHHLIVDDLQNSALLDT